MNIGRVLRTARRRADLTQEDLSFELNIARSTISKIERNEMVPQTEDFIRWMQVVQIKLSNTTAIEAGITLVNGVDVAVLVDMLTQFVGMFIKFIN